MEELYEWLDSIQDYRQPAKVRHKLKDIIVIRWGFLIGHLRTVRKHSGQCH